MGGCGERQASAVLRASALSICSTSTLCSVARSANVRLTLAILLTDLADRPSASADRTNRDLAAGEREERASFFFAFKRSRVFKLGQQVLLVGIPLEKPR